MKHPSHCDSILELEDTYDASPFLTNKTTGWGDGWWRLVLKRASNWRCNREWCNRCWTLERNLDLLSKFLLAVFALLVPSKFEILSHHNFYVDSLPQAVHIRTSSASKPSILPILIGIESRVTSKRKNGWTSFFAVITIHHLLSIHPSIHRLSQSFFRQDSISLSC